MTYKTGDKIKVWTPASRREHAELRHGIVKIVQADTGRIFWYCDPAKSNPCGVCGPRMGDGHHRLGMHGSRLTD